MRGDLRPRGTVLRVRGFAVPCVVLIAVLLAFSGVLARSADAQLGPLGAAGLQETPEGEGEGEDQEQNGEQTLTDQTTPSNIGINKYTCPADYGQDYNQFISNCTLGAAGVTFMLGPGGVDIPGGGGAYYQINDVAPGDITITESAQTPPAGIAVFCNEGPLNQGQGPTNYVPASNGAIGWTLQPGYFLYCDWFNIQDGTGTTNNQLTGDVTIYVNKHFCPVGFDAYNASRNDLALNCQEPDQTVKFTVTDGQNELASGTTSGTPNLVVFQNIPAGQISIFEDVPQGYAPPVVNCSEKDGIGNDVVPTTDMETEDGNRIDWNVQSGNTLFCDWYNAPPYNSWITVYKYDCQDGAAPGNFDLQYYLQQCPDPLADVDFKLDTESTGNPGNQLTDANGVVRYPDMEPDTFFLTETLPDGYGYGPPIVLCRIYMPLSQDPPEYEFYAPTETDEPDHYRIEFELQQTEQIDCYWFNTAPYGSDITVYKYDCQDGAAPGEHDLDWYRDECPDVLSGIPFKLDGASTGNPGEQETDTDGKVVWSNMEADHYFLTEMMPEDSPYGAPIVLCAIFDPTSGDEPEYEFYEPSETDEPGEYRIEFDLEEGYSITCYWFNSEPYGSDITVIKYQCPETLAAENQHYDWYADACHETWEGVTFKLDGASTGNPGEQETDSDGTVVWTNMEADHYYIYETVPDDWDKPVVFCYIYSPFDEQEPDYQNYSVSDEYRIEFDLEEGEFITCYWFNVKSYSSSPSPSPSASPSASPRPNTTPLPSASPRPPASPRPSASPSPAPTGPATLTIRKFDCESGYDFLADDAEPQEDCTDRPDDVTFELSEIDPENPVDAPREADTGGNPPGEAEFSDVDAGDYLLVEADFGPGDGAYVLACDSNVRNFDDYNFSPFAIVAGDGSVRLTLLPGEQLTCDWYNVPGGDGLTVEVYTCTGDEQSVEACDPAEEPVRFVLTPVDAEGDPIAFQTGPGGVANQPGLDGVYTLSEVGQQPCVIESDDVDPNGNLTLSADQPTLVRVFNCA